MTVKKQMRYAVARLTSGEEVRIPCWDLRSGRDGPAFLVLANQHGNEVSGCEAIRRVVGVASEQLRRGRLSAVPFANVLALRQRRPHINMGPEQAYGDDRGHNMNRLWPGNPEGNDTARLVAALVETVGNAASHVLDFHSWSRFGATSILIPDLPECRRWARISGIRFVRVSDVRRLTLPSYLGFWFQETGRPLRATIELAGQYVVVEREVQRGVRAALNFMKDLGMIPGELEGQDEPVIFSDASTSQEVKAPESGLFVESDVRLWDLVEAGQSLGHILSDRTLETIPIAVPMRGYLHAYGGHRAHCDVALPAQHPYVTEGELLARVTISAHTGN